MAGLEALEEEGATLFPVVEDDECSTTEILLLTEVVCEESPPSTDDWDRLAAAACGTGVNGKGSLDRYIGEDAPDDVDDADTTGVFKIVLEEGGVGLEAAGEEPSTPAPFRGELRWWYGE